VEKNDFTAEGAESAEKKKEAILKKPIAQPLRVFIGGSEVSFLCALRVLCGEIGFSLR
jgi:hypothetical protein